MISRRTERGRARDSERWIERERDRRTEIDPSEMEREIG